MSRRIKQIEPSSSNNNFQKSKDESVLPIKDIKTTKKDDDGWDLFGDEVAGFFIDAAPYLAPVALLGGYGLPITMSVAAVETFTGAVSDQTKEWRAEAGLKPDPEVAPPVPKREEVVEKPPVVQKPSAVARTHIDELDGPFGVTAEQNSAAENALILEGSVEPFGVTASSNMTYKVPKYVVREDGMIVEE